MFNLPLIVMCGNRPDGAFPTSSLSGARYTCVASSVLCGSNGLCRIKPPVRTGPVARGPDPVVGAPRASIKRKMARDSTAAGDDKAPMKSVTPELVAENLMLFSWRFCCRKIFPVVHRNLTLSFREPGYVFRSDMRSLCKSWTVMTRDVRRVYMKCPDTASRTWFGVFVSSTAFPMWAKSVCAMAHHRSVSLAQPSNGKMIVPLYQCIEDIFTTMKFTPMSFHTQIEALYLMTAQKSMDINTMILSCFNLHVMGLRTNCNLNVLALACHEETLTTDQTFRYESFCEFLLERISPVDPARSSVIHDGHFKPLKIEQVLSCCEFADNNMHGDIENIYNKRTTDVLKANLSTYIDLGIDVVSYDIPESVQNMMDIKKATAGCNKLTLNPFVCESPDTIVAQLFASQMSEESEAKRMSMQNTASNPIKQNQQMASWWNVAATSGTRLPGKQPKITVCACVVCVN